MKSFRFPFIAVCALALSTVPAAAQTVFVQPATPDADELAAEMRLLAANPDDLAAMIRAGELTLKLDDTTAAAGFFARAERIDPSNPRIKAGKGTLLVQSGRPGEALRQFAEAERLRGDARRFAADRGLAYDLVGEQERAQRDYRLALRDGPADETLRRYALSLGISGKRDEALAQIDALLRRSDRGAWRTRAFILAMTGDTGGAERIAASMMPGTMAQGLQPFFTRLTRLGPVDKAFAVHFGEVRATPQRIADARLVPPLPALLPEPGRLQPAVLAAAVPSAKERRRQEREERRKRGRDRIDLAATPPPRPLPVPPAYQGPAVVAIDQPAPVYVRSTTPAYVQPLPPVALAANRPARILALPGPGGDLAPLTTRPVPDTDTRVAATGVPIRVLSEAPFRASPADPSARAVVTPTPAVIEPRPEPAPVRVATLPPAAQPATSGPATSEPATSGPATSRPAPVQIAAAQPAMPAPSMSKPPATAAQPIAAVAQPVAADVASTVPAAAILPPVPGPAKNEDSILAKIIANITVPGSELDVVPDEPAAAPLPPAAVPVAPDAQAALMAEQKAADRAANERKIADRQLADKKTADKKAAEAKKLADAKKAEDKKKNDPKLLEPSRIWVQVAGGANEGTLPKEWARVRDRAPAAFKGKSGWTTPLRATNRVLAGPFRTDGEARSFVNALAKEGVSAFTFTSDAGQKVAKLAGK